MLGSSEDGLDEKLEESAVRHMASWLLRPSFMGSASTRREKCVKEGFYSVSLVYPEALIALY
jgi:hypothetical protein